MAILTRLAPDVFGGQGLFDAAPRLPLQAAEGAYLDLVALPPSRQALLLESGAGGVVGFVLPLDALLEDRIDAARRLHRLLLRGKADPATLTAYRRGRLKLALRVLDAREAGVGYREIAKLLFPRLHGDDREPSDMLIARAIRLVRYGERLLNGGYLDLLRIERRAPKARRK